MKGHYGNMKGKRGKGTNAGAGNLSREHNHDNVGADGYSKGVGYDHSMNMKHPPTSKEVRGGPNNRKKMDY